MATMSYKVPSKKYMHKDARTQIQKLIAKDYNGDVDAFLRDITELVSLLPPVTSKRAKVRPDAPVMIDLKNVDRTYFANRKNEVTAVRNVSFTVQEGEIVALMGPSGSGKSTLMHLIGGLDRPTNGDLIVDGRSLKDLSESKRALYRNQTVGFVFQFFYLQPFLRLERNVEVPLMFARTKRKTRGKIVQQVIDAVSLQDKTQSLPKELSGGQMQRVAIARALVNRPKVLLADEPTGNLDSANSQHIMELLQTIRETFGTTMIIVTHDPKVAAWADRTLRIEDGRIVS